MRKIHIWHGYHVIFAWMDLTLFRSFVTVIRCGAITEAADQLGITQPALSRRMQTLEQFFDTQLLERGRNGVHPTAAGEIVAREAEIIVDRLDRLHETVHAHLRLEAGTVRLGGGATAVSFLVPPAIAALQRDHETVRFQVKEAGSREIEADVVAEHLELGIVTLPVSSRELDVMPLFEDRIVAVASAQHALSNERSIPISKLAGLSLVGFEGGSAIRQIIDTQLRQKGVEMNVVMELRSIPAILRMVATTGNLAFVSYLGVEGTPVRVLDVRGLQITRQLGVITKRGRSLSPAAAAFLERLQLFVRHQLKQ
jgi:DNA-binding transcriptional LysR family regulator